MKYLLLLSLILLGCSSQVETKTIPESAPYSVRYSVSMTGTYDSLSLFWADPDSTQELTGEGTFTWDTTITGFESGDSLFLNGSFFTVAGEDCGYSYDIAVVRGDEILTTGRGNQDLKNITAVVSIPVRWGYRLP